MATLVALPAAAQDRAPGARVGRAVVAPYIEAGQTVDADLNGGGDVLTYTAVAAGIDAAVTGARS